MSALRRRSDHQDGQGAVRCSFTKGRCWQCTNPALRKRAVCRLHLGSDFDFELPGPEPGNYKRVSDTEENSVRRKRRKRKGKAENPLIKVAGEEVVVKEIRKEFPFGILTVAPPSSSNQYKNPVINCLESRKRTEDDAGQSKNNVQNIIVEGLSTQNVDPEKKRCETNVRTKARNNITAVEVNNNEVMRLLTRQVDLEKQRCETNIYSEAGSNITTVEVNGAEVTGLSTKQVDLTNKSCKTSNPTEAENNITALKVNGTEVMGLSTKQMDPKMKSCETNNSIEAENNIMAFKVDETETIGLSTEQANLKKKSCETNNPTEAENDIIVVEVNRTMAMGLSTKQVDPKNSCQTNIHTEATDTANEVNGIKHNIEYQNKTVEVKNSCYDVRQLLPILKQPSLEQTRELQIEAFIQGKRVSDVQMSVVECSYDGRFECDCCRTKIENLHRSCMRCNYNLCIKCCQVIRARLTEKDETVNSGGPITRKAIESESKNIDCPNNPWGICGGNTVKINCTVHIGWKKFAGATQ